MNILGTLLQGGIGFAKKAPLWLWIGGIALGYIGVLKAQNRSLRSDVASALLSTTETTKINDTLSVRLASNELAHDSLSGALQAADALNAELLAAARVRLTPEKASGTVRTILVTDTIPGDTVVLRPGEQAYIFADTSETGSLVGTILLRPDSTPIVDYEFKLAPIEATISLLRMVDDRVVFGVTYLGQEAEVSAPFARIPARLPRFNKAAGLLYDVSAKSLVAVVRANFRLIWGLEATAWATNNVDTEGNPRFMVGILKQF